MSRVPKTLFAHGPNRRHGPKSRSGGVRMFLDFVACSVHVICVMYLLVVTVVFFVLNVERPA